MKLIRRIATIRRWGREEWRIRLTQRGLSMVERARLAVGMRYDGTDVSPVPSNALSAVAEHAIGPLRGAAARLRTLARQLAARDPDGTAVMRRRVDRLHQGYVALLGVEEMCIGTPPDWHREAASGTVAPLLHWSRIRHLDTGMVGDHKLLWEVNRHQYLLPVALRWLVDGDDRDFGLVQQHLSSWLDRNPVKVGANWASSLEVSYRAISWCWLLWLLRAAPWREDLLVRTLQGLEAHGLHVERYLSTYYSPNTHLTGEALGLVYIGTTVPWSRHAVRFIETGSRILDEQIALQVTKDGVYFEQATQYQRYTAEIFLHHLLLARESARPAAPVVLERVTRLFDVLRSIVSSAGVMPLIGDDDGGLLLPVDAAAPDDLRGLLLLGATALQRPDLRVSHDAAPALSYLLCGSEATEAMLGAPAADPRWTDRNFEEGGTVVLRDGWGESSAVAVIDAGPHGALSCGHSHADALSMTLTLGAQPVIVDRGTFAYSGATRDEFRSTESHNTMEFDGQPSVTPGESFQWGVIPARPSGIVTRFAGIRVFDGVAEGHVDTNRPSLHHRMVMHRPGGGWVVFDRGKRELARRVVARWQLAPGLHAKRRRAQEVDIMDGEGQVVARTAAPLSDAVVVMPRKVSLRYGHLVAAVALEAEADAELRCLWIILPRDAYFAAGDADLMANAVVQRWWDVSGWNEIQVGLRQKARLQVGEHELSAEAIWRIATHAESPPRAADYDVVVAIGSDAAVADRVTDGSGDGAPMLCLQRQPDCTWIRVPPDPLQSGER